MLDKPLEQVGLADLEELIREQSSEGKALDYKRDMYGRTDSDKKELLKDVSAFANTVGGDLIIGVDEAGGIPTAIPGVAVTDIDAEKLRLEEIIRRGIEPRIDFAIHTVGTDTGTTVFIIRVRESWILPHRVVYQGKFGEFWARNSAGNYSMDTTELRRAFNLSEMIYEWVRTFRDERVKLINEGRSAIPMREGAKLVVHLIPLESLRSRVALDFGSIEAYREHFPPLGHRNVGAWGPRLNFDGLMFYAESNKPNGFSTYLQIFRNGVVEAAIDGVTLDESGTPVLRTGFYEPILIDNLTQYLRGLRSLSVRPPVWMYVTLTGVKGAMIIPGNHSFDSTYPIDRDDLYLPETVIDGWDQKAGLLLLPAFDLIWNAAGLPRSLNFGQER